MTIKTILAAAAVTIGTLAHGALPSGTSFESLSAGSVDAAAIQAKDSGATWTLPTNQTVTAYVQSDVQAETRPDQFANDPLATQNNYLAIKTTLGEYVTRNIGEQTIGETGLYVDSLVKFTAADEDLEIPSDAKIAVWVKAQNDEGTVANLMVTAANADGKQVNYDCGVLSDVDAWKRLTVKAISNIDGNGSLGFVVYVDGSAVSCSAASAAFAGMTLTLNANEFKTKNQLFRSLADSAKLSEIAISGQGGIDDISFTDVAPSFAQDFTFYTVGPAEKVTGFTVNGKTWTTGDPLSFVFEGADDLEVTGITYANDYFGPETATLNVTAAEPYTVGVATLLGVTVGDKKFASIQAAVDAIAGGEATGAIKLAKDAELGKTPITATSDITIDLNGKAITYEGEGAAIAVTGNLTIIDSTGTNDGSITVTGEEALAASATETLTISNGTFNGSVQSEKEAYAITGGKFCADDAGEPEAAFPYYEESPWEVEGKFYEAVGANSYWTVQDYVPPTAEVTINPGANVTITVMNGQTEVKSGDPVEIGTVLTITATPAAEYRLASLTVNDVDFTSGNTYAVTSADAITIAAAAEAIPYVAQIGDNKYETLDAAWFAATNGRVATTIKLLTDVTSGVLSWDAKNLIDGTITFDLNDKTLTANGFAKKYFFQLQHGNFVVKNGKIASAEQDDTSALATVFQNYANLTVEDVEIDAANFTGKANPYSDECANIIAVMFGDVQITGSTSIKNNAGYALTIGNHSGNDYAQSGRSVTLNTTGTLAGNFRFCGGKVTYTACGFSEGAKFLYGSAWNASEPEKRGVNQSSIYEDGDLVGFDYVARVGKTPTYPSDKEWYKYFGEFSLTLDAAIAAAKAGDEVAVFKDVTQDTVTIVAGTATTLAIGDEATLKVNAALTLNGAKVALAEGCTLVVPTALDKTADFVAPGEGKEIKVAGEGPFTYTVGDAANPVLPGEPVVVDPSEADAKVAAMNDNKAAYLKAPEDVEFGEGEFTAYANFFTAVANEGKTAIAFELNADGVKAVADAEAAEKSPILEAIAAAEGDTASLTVANPIKGFYYGLKQAGDIKQMKLDQVALAGVDEVTFSLDKSGDAGFYEIVVSPTKIEPENKGE